MQIKDIAQLPEMAGLRRPEAAPAPRAGASSAAGGDSFAAVLGDSLAEVNRLQQQADASITALATTDKASLHDTMIAMEQADVSFRLMMQVRNKIVEAYQEIMRMQV
jgi:flagellar hook-basal body complex protein FliE